MPRNRFEQVDGAQPDALTLSFRRRDDKGVGAVACPASATAGRLPKDYDSGELAAIEAFRSAVKLANELKVPVVVVDPEGVWQAEWGDLYREAEEGTAADEE